MSVSVVLCLHVDGDLYCNVCIVVDAHCCVHDLVCLAVIPWQDSKVGASSSTTLTRVKFIAELLEHWTPALYCNVGIVVNAHCTSSVCSSQGQCAHVGCFDNV